MSIPAGFTTITPYLRVRGAAKAIEFYVKAFGATEMYRLQGPDGLVMHADLKIGTGRLMMSDEAPQWGCLSPLALNGTTVGIHMYVEDVDAAFARAVDAGATPVMPPADMFWGDRFSKLKDPFGHEWTIATKRENLTAEQVRERAVEAMKTMCAPPETAKV